MLFRVETALGDDLKIKFYVMQIFSWSRFLNALDRRSVERWRDFFVPDELDIFGSISSREET